MTASRCPTHLLLLAIPLAGCGLQSAPTLHWAGPVTPTAPGPLCATARGTAQIRAGHLTFAPDDATWILDGTATPDGKLAARRAQPGTNHQEYATTFTGTWSPDLVAGTYTTPRCTYTVRLTRR